jgi:hypothetical protein
VTLILFVASVFNQDIGSWDDSSEIEMKEKFCNELSFNQELKVFPVTDMIGILFPQQHRRYYVFSVRHLEEMFAGGAVSFQRYIGGCMILSLL